MKAELRIVEMKIDLLSLIRKTARELDDARIYYTLRSMKLKRITSQTVQSLKLILALHKLKIPITVQSVSWATGLGATNMTDRLHTLGDKHILVYKRSDSKRHYTWIISLVFLRKLNGEE